MISVLNAPGDRSSAHEQLWHVVDSTNKAGAGFQYVFDVYHDSALLTRIKNTPFGNDKYGVINVGTIVRSKLATEALNDFDVNDFEANTSLGVDVWFVDYDVRYGEQASGTITANLSSGTYRAYNTYKRLGVDGTQTFSSGTVWLTNRPATSYYYTGQPLILSAQALNGVNYRKDLLVNGVSVQNHLYEGSGTCVFFPVESQQEDFSVQVTNTDTSGIIGTKNFKVRCSKYTPRTLAFLNAFGGWDSFTFVNGVLMNENEKKKFELDRWQLVGTAMIDRNGSVENESYRTYANDVKTKMRLTSDILDTGEYTWLAELINSPVVYLYDSGTWYPVQINQSTYELKNALQNKTETLEMEIEFRKFNTQYR